MLQRQHFAVNRVHAVERFLHENALLGLDGGLRRRRQFAKQLRCQRYGIGHRQSAAMQRDFAIGVAQLCAEMTAMELRQLQPGDVPHPQKQRHLRGLRVFRQFAADVQKCFLNHVGVVHPSLQAAAQAQMDHAFETVPIAREQLAQRLLLAARGALQQFRGFTGIVAHDGAHIRLSANARRSSPSTALFFPFVQSSRRRAAGKEKRARHR
jgi:hypothetical protein